MFQATCLLTLLLSASLPAAPLDLYEPSCTYEVQVDTLKASKVSDRRQGRERLGTGAPVIEISSSSIERSGARELHEVLRTLPGLNVKDYGGIGGMKTVSVRGLGANHTSVCVDGMLVNDAQHGSIDLSGFDLDDTGNILVETVSADGIFKPARAFSSGSVISLATKAPDLGGKTARLSARMVYGSFGTLKPTIRFDGKLADGWVVTARGSYLRSNGNYPFGYDGLSGERINLRREGSDVSAFKSLLRLEGNTHKGGVLRASASYSGSERGIPGPVILYVLDPTERIWNKDLSSVVTYESAKGLSPWHYWIGGSFRRTGDRYTNTDAKYQEPVDDRYLLQSLSASGILERTFQAGAGRSLNLAFSQDFSGESLEASTMICPDPIRFGSFSALAVQYCGERLRATAILAATYIHESATRKDSGLETAPDRSRLGPSLSLSYELVPGMHVRAFVKDGFRVPTFNDLYYDRVGSISLVPEKAFQSGAGVTWQGKAGKALLDLTADAYYNVVKDKIVAIPTMFVWRMRNLGRVNMAGADLSAGMSLPVGGGYSFRTDASFSFLRAIDVTDPSAKNYRHQIQYTPKTSGSLSASIFKEGFSLNYTLIAVGRRYFLPQNLEVNALAGYFDHGIAVRKTVPLRFCSLTLAAEALNLAGTNYEIVHSYPMPGRQFRMSVTVTI